MKRRMAIAMLCVTLCANMNESASMTPVQYEGDEVDHHDDSVSGPRPFDEQR